MKKRMVIVGDKFEEFASNEMVVTISEAEEVFSNDRSEYFDVLFELGQGVSAERANRLITFAELTGRREQLLFQPVVKCGQRLVHKCHPENSLISLPKKISDRIYQADMLIDDECELLTDHVSGQHLQGIVLIEAVRQMILAVTEEYYARKIEGPRSFIWHGIQIDYLGYAFPIASSIVYAIDDIDYSRKKRIRFSISAEILQRNTAVCVAKSSVELFDRSSVERREGKLAAQVIVASEPVLSVLAQVQE